MDLKLYGICFKLRGGPDLLDYVQTNTAVPVSVMAQTMEQMGSVTQAEMAFAEKLDNDWKKAFNERVPLLMGVSEDGGYDISCTIPDELLTVVRMLNDMENEKIVEEYAASYLKDVCGVNASIISVDVEQETDVKEAAEEVTVKQGFDLSDLSAVPDAPVLEDVSELAGMDMEKAVDPEIPKTESVSNDTAADLPDLPGDFVPDDYVPDESDYEGDNIPLEEGYPEDGTFPQMDEEESYDEEMSEEADAAEEAVDETVENALTGIYTELVTNIKDRRLDERLGLKIAGMA